MPTTNTEAGNKAHAHELIERLAPNQVAAVVSLLKVMLDPVSQAIASAPIEDEPLTIKGQKALDEAQEWLKHNRSITHEQVLAELGVTQEEIDQFKEPA